MINMTEELKEKLLKAQSLEEVKELLKSVGGDDTSAEQLWKDITDRREGKELSAEELETVTGGADRYWPTDGCAATVEPESICWTDDECIKWDVVYDKGPTTKRCPKCGSHYYVTDSSPKHNVYKCPVCGNSERVDIR